MTLFLDRDGVLNSRIIDGYVCNWTQWEWLPNVLDTLVKLSKIFDTIIVVTNQQGIGKGLFREDDFFEIMETMKKEVEDAGGRLDEYYYCPHLTSDNCRCRKPKIGLAMQALREFPNIDFHQSIMVGDSISDMEFGKSAGMKTFFVSDSEEKNPFTDIYVRDLADFYEKIICNNTGEYSTNLVNV